MKRVLTRLATTVLVAPLALATLAAPAQRPRASRSGCYGATSVVYCDVTVTFPVLWRRRRTHRPGLFRHLHRRPRHARAVRRARSS